jgi:sulfur-oxidizing protein SoxY
MKRRQLLQVTSAAASALCLPWAPPAAATAANLDAALRAFSGGRVAQTGRVELLISPLVENGNAVPVTLRADSPMTAAQHVRRLALFTERNPQPDVAVFHLGPLSGRAEVSTRVRLATSQTLVALAEFSDGSLWQQRMEVLVTLAACIEV